MKEITSVQNPLVKRLAKLRKDRDYRKELGSVVIEGEKLVNEVCAIIEANVVLHTQTERPSEKIKSKDFYQVTEEIIKKISGAQSPEGVIAEIPYPKPHSFKNMHFLVALDGVSDPGNLGTLLRTALSFGWEGVYILDNCCDPFNDKALRSAKGATFRLPLRFGNWSDLTEIVKENQLFPLCADIEGTQVEQLFEKNKILLVLGSESHGPSQETLSKCTQITLPMSGKMESLNVSVAGGILMYLLKKL